MRTTLKTLPRQIRLPDKLWRALERAATGQGKSRAELVREVLHNYAKWWDEKNK